MEWNNFKAPSWDMSSVVDEEATLPNIEITVDDDESSSARFGVYCRTKFGDNDEFSVDLKLGQVGNYQPGSDHIVPNKSKVVSDSASTGFGVSNIAPSSSSSSSYKRARASNNGTLTVSCLVDGCNSDLSTCRDYHRRHKVCEQHSKTPEVIIGGFKQRFCQQCSRFHSLEQFDEGKRSCRKRLDGHNRRRRKPQPESITRPASILSNYQGSNRLISFSSPHGYSSSAMVMSPAWSGELVTSSADSSRLQNHNQHHLFLGSSPPFSYNKEQDKHQLAPFLHNNNATPIFNNNMFCDSSNILATSSVHDIVPPRALSLLSPPSSQTHHTIQMVPHHRKFLMEPLGLSLLRDDDNSNTFESMERILVVPNNNNNNSNGSESDHHCCSSSLVYYENHNMGGGAAGSDGSQGNEAHHQLFPFQWE